MVVRAFDGKGAGRYVDVIAGLNWIVANKAKYNIRVLNLSFGAEPQSYYWDDPLNQAVMAAWKAGIVVVVAAGNDGPKPMTINVPGNVPYVITVGALTDNDTPYDFTDDRLASFSSTGPTYEGFVKPEVVAPGGHIEASMSSSSYLANIDPDSMDALRQLFTMSGTSQAAAVTTGVVALMLQDDPTLTPDAVKCRLIASGAAGREVERQARLQRVPAGRGPHQRATSRATARPRAARTAVSTSTPISRARSTSAVPRTRTTTATTTSWTWAARPGAIRSARTATRGREAYPWNQGYTWSEGYTWSRATRGARAIPGASGYTWSRGYTWSNGYTWSRSLTWWNAPPVDPLADEARVDRDLGAEPVAGVT